MIEINNRDGQILLRVDADTLVGADLWGANLKDADLWDADLRGADLRDAYLRDAVLRSADLQDAVLRSADLQDANLRDADLQGAVLRSADLRDADLRDANLKDANLRGANLVGAKTERVIWGERSPLEMVKIRLSQLGITSYECLRSKTFRDACLLYVTLPTEEEQLANIQEIL